MAAFQSKQYRNLFLESGKTQEEIDARLEQIFQTFFYGSEEGKNL